MGAINSKRTKRFKEQLTALPLQIQDLAKVKYQLFLQNPFHSSFRRRIIQSTKHLENPLWEFSLNMNYRAVCFIDGDTYVVDVYWASQRL
jgi:hypothetical protein